MQDAILVQINGDDEESLKCLKETHEIVQKNNKTNVVILENINASNKDDPLIQKFKEKNKEAPLI